MKKSFVNLKNAATRSDRIYKTIVQKIMDDGVCPFCPEFLTRYHKKPVIKTGKYWILTDNMYPYKGARHHILLIHKKHIEYISQISSPAWRELAKFIRAETKKRNIAGGTFYIRFGDTAATGASVRHLHANIIAPDMRKKNRAPILTRVA
jgi:diadenosine tetraphosphate (Ap4A) HIT family hydrolase